MVLRLSNSRRWLAPLALAVGAFAMLFDGVKLLFTNWRLTLIQVLPAMWIWAAMYDLKAHVLRGGAKFSSSFHVLTGPEVVIPLVLVIAAVTAASFYLNAVFAFAIVQPGAGDPASVHPGPVSPAHRAGFWRGHWHTPGPVHRGRGPLGGVLVRAQPGHRRRGDDDLLRRRAGWLIGMKTTHSKRDKLAASAVGGAVGALICTPPYALGRLGLIMLGSSTFFVAGIIVFAVGLTLQAGATGAVKTIKMSAKLVSGHKLVSDRTPAEDALHPLDG